MSPDRSLAAPALRIEEVRPLRAPAKRSVLFEIERPRPGAAGDTYALALEGWAVGRSAPVARLEVTAPLYETTSLPLGIERADVAVAHPDAPWAARAGFDVAIGTLRLPGRFEFELAAELGDGTREPLAAISGEHALLPRGGQGLRPIPLVTLGRSGSTWAMSLLNAHREIVALQPFRYEARTSAYWADVFAALAEPRSAHQMVAPDVYGKGWWTGEKRALGQADLTPSLRAWVERGYVEDLAAFCRGRIDAFYRQALDPGMLEAASLVVEKAWPRRLHTLASLYPGAGEVFLVRDFRDLACSVLAFNRKRGYQAFGRQRVDTDEEYISGPLLRSARALSAAWRCRAGEAFLLQYESLVQEPEATLTRLFTHLGVDAGSQAVESVLRSGDDATALDQHQTAGSTESSVGRWRRDLSPSQLRAFGGQFEEVLDAFGYGP